MYIKRIGRTALPAIDNPPINNPPINNPPINNPAINNPAINSPAINNPAINSPAINNPAINNQSTIKNHQSAISLVALQPLCDRELALRFFAAPELLQQLREQVVGRLVVGIVLNRAAQHVFGGVGLVGPAVRLPEQDV